MTEQQLAFGESLTRTPERTFDAIDTEHQTYVDAKDPERINPVEALNHANSQFSKEVPEVAYDEKAAQHYIATVGANLTAVRYQTAEMSQV